MCVVCRFHHVCKALLLALIVFYTHAPGGFEVMMPSNVKMSSSIRFTSLVVALAAVLCLCAAPTAHAQMGKNEAGGTAAGAIFGGILGGVIGGRAGNALVGGIAGAVVGSLIGNRIGAQLDEQERRALARATRNAFTSGKSQNFSAKSGVRGRANVISTTNVDGKSCRTVRQDVTLKDGSVLNDTVSACRDANGRWEI